MKPKIFSNNLIAVQPLFHLKLVLFNSGTPHVVDGYNISLTSGLSP